MLFSGAPDLERALGGLIAMTMRPKPRLSRRTRRWPLALLALCLPSATAVQTAVIRFGMTGDYPPFAERRADGTLVGADVETARHVASALGARAEFVATTWPDLEADFAAGRFDVAIGGLSVTPARAALGQFTHPVMEDGKRPLARCDQASAFTSLAAIDRPLVRVMINRGAESARLAKLWFTRALITVNMDDATLADQLLTGQADVWVGDGVAVDMLARRYPGRLCATTPDPFTHLTKAWLVRRDPALVPAIDRALAAEVASGAWRAALEAIH